MLLVLCNVNLLNINNISHQVWDQYKTSSPSLEYQTTNFIDAAVKEATHIAFLLNSSCLRQVCQEHSYSSCCLRASHVASCHTKYSQLSAGVCDRWGAPSPLMKRTAKTHITLIFLKSISKSEKQFNFTNFQFLVHLTCISLLFCKGLH